MHKRLSCTVSRLSSSEPIAVVGVSRCLPGLQPIQLYWLGTGITELPFPADSSCRNYTGGYAFNFTSLIRLKFKALPPDLSSQCLEFFEAAQGVSRSACPERLS